jgi:hypothetical protein
MRLLDFRFNGLTIEPIIELNSSEKSGAYPSMQNIKQLSEAKRLRESLDVAIQAMEEKEKQDSWETIITLEDTIDKRAAELDIDRAKLEELRKAHARHYDYSPLAAEQT